MVSSYNFQKEEKLWSVFNLFKEGNNNKSVVTYESTCNAVKTLNLNINKEQIKKCFEKYKKEIDFESFKKLILDSESDESTYGNSRRSSKKALN